MVLASVPFMAAREAASEILPSSPFTTLQHLPQDFHQRAILQRSSNPLFITQLLINLLTSAMRPLLDPHIHPESCRQSLFKADPNTEPNDCCETAVGDCGRYVDGADGEGGTGWEWGEVDVWELDDGEGAEG